LSWRSANVFDAGMHDEITSVGDPHRLRSGPPALVDALQAALSASSVAALRGASVRLSDGRLLVAAGGGNPAARLAFADAGATVAANDVFLWKPLDDVLLAAPVFAELPETGDLGDSCYRPEAVEHALRRSGGWMPDEFMAWMPHGGRLIAPN